MSYSWAASFTGAMIAAAAATATVIIIILKPEEISFKYGAKVNTQLSPIAAKTTDISDKALFFMAIYFLITLWVDITPATLTLTI